MKRPGITIMAGLALAGLLTGCYFPPTEKQMQRIGTLPANYKPEWTFATMTFQPPVSNAWRIVSYSKRNGFITYFHLDAEAAIIAFWEPVFPNNSATNTVEIAGDFFREHAVKDLELSPDFHIDSVQPGAAETWNSRSYQSWRLRFTKLKKKDDEKHQCLLYAHASPTRPDLFVFFVTVPDKHAAQQEECEKALHDLIASVRLTDYQPADVALARADEAFQNFIRLADREKQERDVEKIRKLRETARTEAENASRLKPNSPHPSYLLGSIASRNEEGLRFGDGFDRPRAEEYFQRSIQIRSSYLPPHESLAAMYQALGKNEEAEREWKIAVDADPTNDNSHYKLGRFYQKAGRDQEALDCFREALRFWRGAALTRKEVEKDVKELEKKTKAQ